MKRRDVLKSFSLALMSTVTAGYGSSSGMSDKEKQREKPKKDRSISKKKNPKVVVVGGGWSGLAFAKHIKIFAPHCEVVMVEKKRSLRIVPYEQ